MDDAREFMGVCPQHDSLQALRRCSMALLSVTELESCSLATELAVLTGLILPFIEVSETYMGTYMSLFSGISPHRPAARAAYTAQVSVARLGHLPHLVPHSLALADMAGRALTKSPNNWVGTSRGRPEATPVMLKNGFGFASPFLPLVPFTRVQDWIWYRTGSPWSWQSASTLKKARLDLQVLTRPD